MPPTTQRTSIMDKECTAMTSSKSINVDLFQYPIVSTSTITTAFKISCQQLLPIQSSNDSFSTEFKAARESIYKIICNGQFTGHDYGGTKINEWFSLKHIDLYLSWLLLTNRIHNKYLDDIMILPYTIFCEFEDNSDNKNDALTSSIYDDLVFKKRLNIFDASLVFIFIFGIFVGWRRFLLVSINVTSIPIINGP